MNNPSHNLTRTLDQKELGIEEDLQEFEATVSFINGKAIVRINIIQGEVKRPFSIVKKLSDLAFTAGASILRIEATIANQRLYDLLKRCYALTTEGGIDYIEVSLSERS